MKQITDSDIKQVEELLYHMEYHSPADKTTLLLAVVQKMAIDLHKSNDADTRNASYLIAIRYIDAEFNKKNRSLKNIVRLFTACVQDYSTINEISPIEKDVLEYIIENKKEILKDHEWYYRNIPMIDSLIKYLVRLGG